MNTSWSQLNGAPFIDFSKGGGELLLYTALADCLQYFLGGLQKCHRKENSGAAIDGASQTQYLVCRRGTRHICWVNRESGVNPELPRSGNWERTMPWH